MTSDFPFLLIALFEPDTTRIERVGAKEGDEVNWDEWKILSRCGNPERRRRRRTEPE